MLNKKISFLCLVFITVVSSGYGVMATAVNTNMLNILSMIESKKYLPASRLLEKEIAKTRDQKTKGYYAFLLTQFPLNISTKRARHEYTFMAARWTENVPVKKRMEMWIEAADGFFKIGDLKKADLSYKQAFSLASKQKAQSEITYILYKRAWVKINEKKWKEAFRFLQQALKEKENQLKENILSNMGQIWVESQYSKGRIPLKDFKTSLHSVSLKQQKIVMEGMFRGMNRTKKKGIHKIVSLLAKNKKLSTQVLNHILSRETSMIVPPCKLLSWIKTADITKLNKDQTLSVLNSCTKILLSKKRKSRMQKKQIQTIVVLYEQLERKGIERWPLVQAYEHTGQIDKACNESLYQLVEITKNKKEKKQNTQLKETLTETFRLCKKVKTPPSFSEEAIKALLSSNKIIKNYKTTEGEWENILFHLLDMKIFYPTIRKHILKLSTKWKGKDLLPELLLSHIPDYKPKEIKDFLNRFSPNPIKSYYLETLIARDFLTVEELQVWLPLSSINSYRKILPWLKKMISKKLTKDQKQNIMAKLRKHFPSGKKDKRDASLFLALHYLKTDQMTEIFKTWNQISSAFSKKNLAIELFEKSLNDKEKNCTNLKSLPIAKELTSSLLLKFIAQCCQIINAKKDVVISGFKPPSSLQSSALAKDFVFLVRIQNQTLWLEKGISQLQHKTSKMIMNLKTSITRYQKREWRLKEIASKAEVLLQKQIDLFDKELTKLAASSPHSEKYKELKKIVSQWR